MMTKKKTKKKKTEKKVYEKAEREWEKSSGFFKRHKSLFILGGMGILLIGGLIGAYLYVLSNYEVTTVYVEGNVHYTNEEVIGMVMEGRYGNNSLLLSLKYKDKSIYDVLNMTVEEALTFFENVPSIRRKIETLYDVGLSYIRLGQPSTTLSGGEAQRIKLAAELSKRSTGKTIYILDEPTTGLHFADVHKLIEILRRLSEGGNTVVVIEHNLDVIKTADYIIDIGPEGGDRGGTVIAKGTPEEVAASPVSYTGRYVKKYLNQE